MTTKIRIIVGFSILLLLLGTMAFFGYSSLQTASTNFVDYRRMANVNVDTSDLQSTVFEVVYFLGLFQVEQDAKKKSEHVAAAQKSLERGLGYIAHSQEMARDATNVELLAKASEQFGKIKKALDSIQQNATKVDALYKEMCEPYLVKTDKALKQLAEGGRANSAVEALYWQTEIWRAYLKLRKELAQFQAAFDIEAARRMNAAMTRCDAALASLGGAMDSAQGVADHAAMTASFSELRKGLSAMLQAGEHIEGVIKAIKKESAEVRGVVASVNKNADTLMRAKGSATLDSNASAQWEMLLLSLIGFVAGAVFAIYTIVSLVRTLAKMSLFAKDIAEGNFSSNITITEKGEIGAMFAALRRIPEIFAGVIGRCNDIANDISSGQFRDRLDLQQFSGGFRDLAQGINAIADSYTTSIDSLPVGIVSVDTRLATKFVNTTGSKMVGSDALKAFGGKMPLMEASINDNRMHTAETRVSTPDGNRLDVAATSMALHNLKGEIVGGLEVLTDISEIKEKQNIMLQVAEQASAISDRVAAASEELAAQVEQVSRGAEIQRHRVETTASAMTEMNSTVAEVARSATEASSQGAQTREQAESGAVLVNKVVTAINEVNAIALKLQENMETLGHQAESIGSVMNVISDIADQTNLLALNAAIEAARAGEAGRGFAVVADEVRKLAENTMEATKEVGDNIVAIQSSARSNISEVGVAAKNAAEATALANDSGIALQGILHLASATSSVVASIATAAEEQSAASEEITQAVDEINRLVSETTEGMIQSSEAVQDLSRTAQELKRVMEGLR